VTVSLNSSLLTILFLWWRRACFLWGTSWILKHHLDELQASILKISIETTINQNIKILQSFSQASISYRSTKWHSFLPQNKESLTSSTSFPFFATLIIFSLTVVHKTHDQAGIYIYFPWTPGQATAAQALHNVPARNWQTKPWNWPLFGFEEFNFFKKI
jgi:hypothetical protein